ncbi:MAG: Cytochrome c oxidase polypeptide [Labilithrix sp.]|nr:Cytochrome c oxidase polypeptide [Labilithrix sp.]
MSDTTVLAPQEHFATIEQQAHAARLGMWVFLASEVLLFGAIIALFTSYQVHYPDAFRQGVDHNTKLLGSINTGVLLTSSTAVACSVHALRAGKRRLAGLLVAATIALGAVFLVIKLTEYAKHFHEGIYPGGAGSFFQVHHARGLPEFWTLYFGMTGLHALHVTIGLTVLGVLLSRIMRAELGAASAHRLELGAIYWHLVDVIWIFLWPLLYLA